MVRTKNGGLDLVGNHDLVTTPLTAGASHDDDGKEIYIISHM